MWCPACQKTVHFAKRCPSCGGELQKAWGRSSRPEEAVPWPQTEDGEPVTPVYLCNCVSVSLVDEVTANMLNAAGIPTLRRFSNGGDLGRVVLGMSGFGVDLYVPETMLEEARALLEADAEEDDDQDLL